MKLYSYVVARDYGFAPNPFFGLCTLATCKPQVRQHANVGDWIVGTGSARNGAAGRVVYVMRVTKAMTFDEYWTCSDFRLKRPNLRGSRKQAYGDNIYHRGPFRRWQQEDSHHSHTDGSPNPQNIQHDTRVDRVLVSTDFAYWGACGPMIPNYFRRAGSVDICAVRGHKCRFPPAMVDDFVRWFRSLRETGYLGEPFDWSNE